MSEQGPLSGQVLGGKYRLGALLGQGGFGAVYQAENQVLQRPQAIKVLLEERFSDARFRERFLREARTLGALDHAHIVHVDDLGVEGHLIYLVMPLISGGTFQDILKARSGPLGLDETTRYLEAICSALGYAHAQGVVHLDLKPLNLLVHQDGRLLLSDFGLAHLLEQGVVAGGTSLQFGSPLYMAPEHFEGQPEARSDLYAVGLILYQMLAGMHPFEASTPAAIMRKHLMDPPPPLAQARPDLPASLDSVLAKALAKQPDQRYQTAGALLVGFKMAVAGQGMPLLADASTPVKPTVFPGLTAGARGPEIGPPRPTGGGQPAPGSQAARQVSRRNLLIGLGAGAGGVAVLGGGAFVFFSTRGSSAKQPNLSPLLLYSVDYPLGLEGFTGWSWSPDGTRLAIADVNLSKNPSVTTIQVWDVQAKQQVVTWSSTDFVFFEKVRKLGWEWMDTAPYVAWTAQEQDVHFLNLITQQEIGVYPFSFPDDSSISDVYLAPNGVRAAIIEDKYEGPATVHIWDIIENRELCSFADPEYSSNSFSSNRLGEFNTFLWSPDGKQFLAWGNSGILYVCDAQAGKQITSYGKHYDEHIHDQGARGVTIKTVAWSPNGQFIATSATANVVGGEPVEDNSAHIWSALDGSQQWVYPGAPGPNPASVAWSKDSSMLATAGQQPYSPVQVWGATNGGLLFTYSADALTPFLAWSPLGARIASGPTIHETSVLFKIWNARDGQEVVEYPARHAEGVELLLWSPDGKRIAVLAEGEGDSQTTLQIWEGGH